MAKTSNHVSLLQRNEQQFYDNLLVMYNCTKCAEAQEQHIIQGLENKLVHNLFFKNKLRTKVIHFAHP